LKNLLGNNNDYTVKTNTNLWTVINLSFLNKFAKPTPSKFRNYDFQKNYLDKM
jgi:hypothetical protein